jgi:hypothetical protein
MSAPDTKPDSKLYPKFDLDPDLNLQSHLTLSRVSFSPICPYRHNDQSLGNFLICYTFCPRRSTSQHPGPFGSSVLRCGYF